jgi:hypothetical protein
MADARTQNTLIRALSPDGQELLMRNAKLIDLEH